MDAYVDKVAQTVARKATGQGKYASRVDTAVSYVNRANATVPQPCPRAQLAPS